MSDRRAWLDEPCPTCWRSLRARCSRLAMEPAERCDSVDACPLPPYRAGLARSLKACLSCKAPAGEDCTTPSGCHASHIHEARLRPGRHELLRREAIWEELERRGTHCRRAVLRARRAWRRDRPDPALAH